MGYISTLIFSVLGFTFFAFGIVLIQIAGHTLFMILVRSSRKQDNFLKIIQKLPLEIYCLTDIGNLNLLKSELMLEAAFLRATLESAVSYIEEETDNVKSKILQYNFVSVLLRYFRTFNRNVDNLLNSFPAPPELPGEMDN